MRLAARWPTSCAVSVLNDVVRHSAASSMVCRERASPRDSIVLIDGTTLCAEARFRRAGLSKRGSSKRFTRVVLDNGTLMNAI
jgi:hypothetical protein